MGQRFRVGLLISCAISAHLWVALAYAQIEDDAAKLNQLRMRQMAQCARELKIVETIDGSEVRAELVEKPVLRWNDAPRDHPDGSLWIWESRGRPVAILEIYPKPIDDPRISHCGHSLSTAPTKISSARGVSFSATDPGVAFTVVSDAPTPADTETARSRQFKEIARRFSAHEYWLPGDTRYELRLLTQPVHRYQSRDAGILSGAVFVFCHSTNPETAMLIELAKEGAAAPKWRFALARIGHAEFHVLLDDKEVWTVPRADRVPASDAYWGFVLPAPSVPDLPIDQSE